MFLFLANFYVCRGLFSVEYLRHMGSIEASFIGISRWVLAHHGDLTWFSLWYDGIPFQNTYPPLLHRTVALVAWIRGITPAHAYHWTTGLTYCLGPVTVFALVRRLSRTRWVGFMAGALYTALSPSAWLIPHIASDIGSAFRPRRLHAMLVYGEGPHISGMLLLPLAILAVHVAMTKRTGRSFAVAAVALAACVLTNWIAGFALAMGVAAYLLARMGKDRWRDYLLVAAMGAAAYGLAMPWAPPSTIATMQFNARTMGDYTAVYHTLPQWLAAMACGLGILKLATRTLSTSLQFAVFFAFMTVLVTTSEAWFHAPMVPQPERYHLEMEMALVILAALIAQRAMKRLPHRVKIGAMVVLSLVLIVPLKIYRRYARTFLVTTVQIEQTSEWKTADWLNKHWSGERVLMPGSTMFWLPVFGDVPQLGGGVDQAETDYELRVARYGITAGEGPHWGEWSVLWLKALGVQAVGVSGPGSTEVYKPYRDPKKFEGLLEPLWRDGGDVIYRVGKAHASLARVVPRGSLVARTPENGADVDPLRGYVAALEDPAMPEARVTWSSEHEARITGDMSGGQVISLQMAWHPGWHASSGGRAIPIERDALGLMTIDARGNGPIDLVYDGGMEMRVAQWICGITILGLLGVVR